jgi:hypothetical protein
MKKMTKKIPNIYWPKPKDAKERIVNRAALRDHVAGILQPVVMGVAKSIPEISLAYVIAVCLDVLNQMMRETLEDQKRS